MLKNLEEKFRVYCNSENLEVNQNKTVKSFGGFTPDKVTVQQLGQYNSNAIKLMKIAGWQ